ncbi:MAG: TolC family protein [Candidatus Electrothrix sp. YB6]
MNSIKLKYILTAGIAAAALCLLFTAALGKEVGKEAVRETAQSKSAEYDLSAIEVLDLETAQRIALQGNPGIGAAQARLEQAKARVKQAMAADMPGVQASGSTGLARYSDSNFDLVSMSQPDADQNYETSTLALQASWLLFDGHAKKFQQEQARYGLQSSVAGRRNTRRLLVSAVADAFFNAQLAQTSIEIAEANRDFYTQQLQDAENRLEVGSGLLSDVLNIKVQRNAAENTLLVSRRDYEAAGYGLAALLGIADSTLPEHVQLAELDRDCDISADSADDFVGETDQLIKKALQERPDLKALSMRIKAAEAGVGQAEAANWPTVQIVGQVGGDTQDGLLPGGDDLGGSIGLSASWTLYSGGAVQASILEARQAKREAKYSHAELRNSIAAEVRQNVVRLAAAREQVRLQRETVALVEENRKLAKSEYEAGSASLVRLNEAQRDLTATYARLVQAVTAYQQARHQLLAAVGRNLEPFSIADEP